MNINAIIFDFNGLIVDDEPIHFDLFVQVLRDEEISLSEEIYWKDYLGFDDKGLFEAIFAANGKKITPKKIKDLTAKKNNLYFPTLQSRLKFFPGVQDFVHDAQKKYPLSIVSGALRSEIDYVLKAGKIDKCFELIVSADDTKHGKPDPEGFMMALAKLKKIHPHITPETCLVLEDSLAGIEAALRARMHVIALPHTYPAAKLTEANQVVATFDELRGVVGL